MEKRIMQKILLDCDGVITLDRHYVPYNKLRLRPGINDFIKLLKKKGFTIVIHSARNNIDELGEEFSKRAMEEMIKFLNENDVYYDWISYNYKPVGILVDDRGYFFDGDFDKTLEHILNQTQELKNDKSIGYKSLYDH